MIYENIDYFKAKEFADNQTILYGTAYDIDNNTGYIKLTQAPIKGMLVDVSEETNHYHGIKFFPIGKNGLPRKTGGVWYDSRQYADTLDECIDLHDKLVQSRINILNRQIHLSMQDFIKPQKIGEIS